MDSINLLTLLLIISFFLIFSTLALLMILFSRMKNILEKQEEIIKLDKKVSLKMSHKIEDIAAKKIDETISATSQELERELKKHFDQMSKYAAEESNKMGQFIIKQQEVITKESQYHVANMLLKAEKDVGEYKKTKMNEVDQGIRDIVFKTAREVIGRAISFTEHEDLVNKALERAKKEKIFS